MIGVMKPKESVSNQSKSVMQSAIATAGINLEDYTCVYAYFLKSGLFSKKVFNYAIGLSKDKETLVVVPISSDADFGNPNIIKTKDIVGVKKSKTQGTLNLTITGQDSLTISIPYYTARNADATYMYPIEQSAEAEVVYGYLSKKS